MSEKLPPMSEQAAHWAAEVFQEVYHGTPTEHAEMPFMNGYRQFNIPMLRESVNRDAVRKVARLFAERVKDEGLVRFVDLILPVGVIGSFRVHVDGISLRAVEVYCPPSVNEGQSIAVPEMELMRFDVAGYPAEPKS